MIAPVLITWLSVSRSGRCAPSSRKRRLPPPAASTFDLRVFPGGHFYFVPHQNAVISAVCDREMIKECDPKLARYRAALDRGTDSTVVTEWITQAQAERVQAQAPLRHHAERPAEPAP